MNDNINILHLSDLHYDSNQPNDVKIILNALWEDLTNFSHIDFIVFSGDLVKAGDKETNFDEAFNVFIKPLLLETGVPVNRFFIAPGNHEIQRSQIDRYLETGLQNQLKCREDVNEFLEMQIENDFYHIERLENFNRFKKRFETQPPSPDVPLTSNKLHSTYALQKGPYKIGIACLNTSWRATGQGDNHDMGNLLIGERQLEAAVNAIEGCHLKLAVYHHPLDWLTEYDNQDMTRQLSKRFDLAFCGHLHKSNIKFEQRFDDKAILVQGGSLNKGRKYLNSYAVVSLEKNLQKGIVYLRTYFDDREEFDEAANIIKGGHFAIRLKNFDETKSNPLKNNTTSTPKETTDEKNQSKSSELFRECLEYLEQQNYHQAFKAIREAQQLTPDKPELNFFYCLSSLSGKPLLAIETSQMNQIVGILETIIHSEDPFYVHLARLTLGIIRLEFYKYKKEENNHQKKLFQENAHLLQNYHPTTEEKDWLNHLAPSQSTRNIFNLN